MLAEKWIKLSIVSLALAGLYSIFIVILRTPVLTNFFVDKSIFFSSLIVHVDLSVLLWLVSFILMLKTDTVKHEYKFFVEYSIQFLYLSVILIFLSPMLRKSVPYMNNYVPILHNLFFIIGLGIFFAVFLFLSVLAATSNKPDIKALGYMGIFVNLSLYISAYKLGQVNMQLDQHRYYELLFWGFGHILQFYFCSGLVIVIHRIYELPFYSVSTELILWLNNFLVLPIIIAQIFIQIDHPLYMDLFTEHMKICGGIAIMACLISTIFDSYMQKKSLSGIGRISMIFCGILFIAGGLIGLAITSTNVTVPSHYHGSIVGITIGFMGYIYILISRYIAYIDIKAATRQITIYSTGQIIHIAALAYSGGYGVLRKTPNAEISAEAKIAMGVMGLGGLLAIVGGLYFVYICTRSLMRK